jgi:hypothetical protein
MGQITLLVANDDNRVESTVIADASRYQFVTISADGLGVGETVDVKMVSNGTPVVVADPATGTAIQLTPALPAVQLAGGVVYQLTKSITVANCGLFMDTGPGI